MIFHSALLRVSEGIYAFAAHSNEWHELQRGRGNYRSTNISNQRCQQAGDPRPVLKGLGPEVPTKASDSLLLGKLIIGHLTAREGIFLKVGYVDIVSFPHRSARIESRRNRIQGW